MIINLKQNKYYELPDPINNTFECNNCSFKEVCSANLAISNIKST